MENSKPLATESFSYSWLVEKIPCSNDKFTEYEYENENDRNFDFDLPFTSASFVDADDIFSNGLIMPFYVHKTLKTSNSAPQSPVSSYNYLPREIVCNKKRCFGLQKWRRSLKKWFGLVKPLYQTIGCTRKSNRVDDLERKVCEVRSLSNSVEASPRPSSVTMGTKKVKSWRCSPQNGSTRVSPARPSNAWCVDESSIHEAILYCKRSIEN